MKKRAFFIMGILCCLSLAAYAQTAVKEYGLRGTFKSDIPTFILLKSSQDSSLVQTTACDSLHEFHFAHLRPGHYYLEASVNGEKGVVFQHDVTISESSPQTIHSGSYDGKDLLMMGRQLTGVTVKGKKKNVYEQKFGTFTFNVKNSSLVKGAKAFDALRLAPMVDMDMDDHITVMGKSPSVYLNGRPTSMPYEAVISYLKSIPAINISKIEVITAPSARYPAAGSGMVVNIVYDRSAQLGIQVNGSFHYKQIHSASYSPALSINVNTKKMRFFASGNYNWGDRFVSGKHLITYNLPESAQLWKKEDYNKTKNRGSYNLNGGAELYLNTKNTFYLSLNMNHGDSKSSRGDSACVYQKTAMTVDSILKNRNYVYSKSTGYSADFYHTYYDEKKSIRLQTGIGYFYSKNNNEQDLFSRTTTEADDFLSETGYKQGSHPKYKGMSVQSDYSMPLMSDDRLSYSGGLRYSYTDASFPYSWYDWENDAFTLNAGKTSQYQVKEHIGAVYSELRAQIGHVGIQAGLRGEYTATRVNGNADNVDRSYFDLFPSVFIQYRINDDHSIMGGASRDINRPNYSYLDPNRKYENLYKYTVGNPYLKAQHGISTSLRYVLHDRYSLNFFYARNTDAIFTAPITDSKTQSVYTTPLNLGKAQGAGIILSVPFDLLQHRWNINTNIGYKGDKNEAKAIGYESSWRTYCTINHNESYRISDGTRVGFNFFYVSKHLQGVMTRSDISSLDIEASQDFFKDLLTLSVRVRNIMNTGNQTGYRYDQSGSFWEKFYSYDRGISFTLSWNFQKGFKRRSGNKGRVTRSQMQRTNDIQ